MRYNEHRPIPTIREIPGDHDPMIMLIDMEFNRLHCLLNLEEDHQTRWARQELESLHKAMAEHIVKKEAK